MNFPGKNCMTLSAEALAQIVSNLIPVPGGVSVRILSSQVKDYPRRLEIEFTTDPPPACEVVDTKAA